MITGPRGSLAYLSSSIFQSAYAMDFDYHSLHGNDIVLFSDMSSLKSIDKNNIIMYVLSSNQECILKPAFIFWWSLAFGLFSLWNLLNLCWSICNRAACDNEREMENNLVDLKESSEEINKISFICSCIVDSLNDGGSVLIPIGRLDIVLKLLEELSRLLESSNLKVLYRLSLFLYDRHGWLWDDCLDCVVGFSLFFGYSLLVSLFLAKDLLLLVILRSISIFHLFYI